MTYTLQKAMQHSESVTLPRGCDSRGSVPNNDSAKVGVNPPMVTLGSLTTVPTL